MKLLLTFCTQIFLFFIITKSTFACLKCNAEMSNKKQKSLVELIYEMSIALPHCVFV